MGCDYVLIKNNKYLPFIERSDRTKGILAKSSIAIPHFFARASYGALLGTACDFWIIDLLSGVETSWQGVSTPIFFDKFG